METRIQKWGNSLALRIPKSFAREAALEEATVVDLVLIDGKITITPIARPRFTLEELLAGITDENLHGEVDFGHPVGKEEW